MSEEEQEPAKSNNSGHMKWVAEDGQAEVSFESDSSGRDSFEADMSLDVVSCVME